MVKARRIGLGVGRLPPGLALFVLGISVYLLTLPADLRNNADTVDRFIVTQDIVRKHTLEYACKTNPRDARVVRGRHGCWYAIYAPGQTMLMIPLYGFGKAVSMVTGVDHDFAIAIAVRSIDPILGALLLVFFYLLAMQLGYRRRVAILLTLLLAFASTLWPDVQSGQEQTQITLAMVAAVYAALRGLHAPTVRKTELWLLGCGVASGFGIFTRYDFVSYAAVLFAFALWLYSGAFTRVEESSTYLGPVEAWNRREDPEPVAVGAPRPTHHAIGLRWALHGDGSKRHGSALRILPFVLGFLPFVVADSAWNTVRFGAPWLVGQSPAAQFGYPIWQGVSNLLVSPAKGLIWYLPLVWLVPFAFSKFRQRAPQMAWLLLALTAAAVLFYANVIYWHGDPAWGPRYLFPLVPLLLLPLGEILELFPSLKPSRRAVILMVIGVSVAVQLAAVTVDPWRFWYHLIQARGQAGQVFHWNPRQYNYYWTSDPAFDPELYQFVAVKDVALAGLGDSTGSMPMPTPAQRALSARCPIDKPLSYDRCQEWGVALRPLDSLDSMWLSDRYQWTTPASVPLSIVARVLIVGLLLASAIASALVLHLQFWKPEPVG